MAKSSSSAGKKKPKTVKDIMITNKINKNDKEIEQSVSMTTSSEATLTVTTALGNNTLLTLKKSTLTFNVAALSDYDFNEELPNEISALLTGELTVGRTSDSVKLEQKNFEELVLTIKTEKGKDAPALVCMVNADSIQFIYKGKTYLGANKEASSDNKKVAGNSFQMTTAFFERIAPKYKTVSDIPPFLIGEYFSLTTKALNADAKEPFTRKVIGNYTFISYSYEEQNYAFVIDTQNKQEPKYYLYHDGKCFEIKNYNLNKVGFAGLSLYSHNGEIFLVANVGSGKSSKSIKLALPKDKELCAHLLGALDENFNNKESNSGVFSKKTESVDDHFEDNGYDAINFNGYVAYTAAPNNLTNYSFAIKPKNKSKKQNKTDEETSQTIIFLQQIIAILNNDKKEYSDELDKIKTRLDNLLKIQEKQSVVINKHTTLLNEILNNLSGLTDENLSEILSEIRKLADGMNDIFNKLNKVATAEDLLKIKEDLLTTLKGHEELLKTILEKIDGLDKTKYAFLKEIFESLNTISSSITDLQGKLDLFSEETKDNFNELKKSLSENTIAILNKLDEINANILKISLPDGFKDIIEKIAILSTDITWIKEQLSTNPTNKEILEKITENSNNIKALLDLIKKLPPNKDYTVTLTAIVTTLQANNTLLQEMKTELTNLKTEMAATSGRIAELKKRIEEQEQIIKGLKTGITKTHGKLDALKKAVEEGKITNSEALKAINEQLKNMLTKDDLTGFATKKDLEEFKNSILAAIAAIKPGDEKPGDEKPEEKPGEEKPGDEKPGEKPSEVKPREKPSEDKPKETPKEDAEKKEDKPSQDGAEKKKEEKKEDDDLKPWKPKLNTTFWGETAMPLVAFFALVACALTGIGALAVLAIAAVAVSGVLIAIDGTELTINRSIKGLRDNKYSKFRSLDNECEHGKQSFKENSAEMADFIEKAGDEDFASEFLGYYGDYGIAKEVVNYAERYTEAMGREPDEETLQKFTEFNMISDSVERQRKIDEYLDSLSGEDKAKVKTAFARSPFLDSDQAEIQHEACNEMRKIESETTTRRSEMEDRFISSFLPGVEEGVRSQFISDFQKAVKGGYTESSIDSLIGTYLPTTISEEDKKALHDIAKSTGTETEKGVKIRAYATEHSGQMRDKKVAEIKGELFGSDEKIESMTEFRKKLEPYQASAMDYAEKRQNLNQFVSDQDYFMVVQIFREEKDDTRKRALFDRYSDIITRKMLSQNKNPVVIIDKILEHLPEDMRDYAARKIQYQASKLDRSMALLHKDVYTAVKKTRELESVRTYAKAIYQSSQMKGKEENNPSFENASENVHDFMIRQDCSFGLTNANDLMNARSYQIVTGVTGRPEPTFGDMISDMLTSDPVQPALKDYHQAIENSGILDEIWEGYFASGKMPQGSEGNSFTSKAVNAHIRQAFIDQIVKREMDASTEEDFDKRVVTETKRRKELAEKSLDEILTEISKKYTDVDKFCAGDERLQAFNDILKQQKTLAEKVDESSNYENFASHLAEGVTTKKYITFKKDGKIELKKPIATYVSDFDKTHKKEGLSLKKHIESLENNDEKIAIINLLYKRILAAEKYDSLKDKPENPEENRDYQIYQTIDKIILGKMTGSLTQELIAEATRRNVTELSDDKALEEALKEYTDLGKVEKFTTEPDSLGKEAKEAKTMQDMIATLPRRVRVKIKQSMKKLRETHSKESTAKIFNMALKEVAQTEKLYTDKTIEEELKSRVPIVHGLDINSTEIETFEGRIDLEESAVRRASNRAYSTREDVLSGEIVEDEVKRTRRAIERNAFESGPLDSESILSKEEKKALAQKRELEQTERDFAMFKNIESLLQHSDYETFAQNLEKLTQLDETAIETFGLKEDVENAILNIQMLIGSGDPSSELLAKLGMTKEQVKQVREKLKKINLKNSSEKTVKEIGLSTKDLLNIRQVMSLIGKDDFDAEILRKLGLSEEQIKKLQSKLAYLPTNSDADFMRNAYFKDIADFVGEYKKLKLSHTGSAAELKEKLQAIWEKKSKKIKDEYDRKIKRDKEDALKKENEIKKNDKNKKRKGGFFRRFARAVAKSDLADKKTGPAFADAMYANQQEAEDKRIKADIGKEEEEK